MFPIFVNEARSLTSSVTYNSLSPMKLYSKCYAELKIMFKSDSEGIYRINNKRAINTRNIRG